MNILRNFKLPRKDEINLVFTTFSKKEWLVFFGFLIILIVSTLSILQGINKYFLVSVPMEGGSISEGIIGTPRFINPLLANSSTDTDLVSIIYSGLMRKNEDGAFFPDLAEKYEMSKDGLTYIFTLKDKIYFHDGKPVTVDDVIFTINQARDPIIKSTHKNDWDSINVEKVDEKTIKFSLKQPHASFLEHTTMGVMPAHIWSGSPIELNNANINPVGSGPYFISGINKQSSGIINYYELSRFDDFILGEPYIKKINLRFYQNENDLIKGLLNKEVEQISSITPENAEILKEKKYNLESSTLPRIFGLFLNQNQNQIFTDKNIVKAIDLAIDKERIIREVLYQYGVVIDNPIPPNLTSSKEQNSKNNLSQKERIAEAEEILAKDGWKKNASGFLEKITTDKNKKKTTVVLKFSISTGNASELAKTAELIKQDLEALGMQIDVKTFEIGNLNQSVIRPRNYDVLLFGQIINRESDLFAFWHSSQRKDPGLNVAMYTNAKVDKILEDAFITIDEQSRIKKYTEFENEIKKDMPAVFLYSPNFIYVVSKDLGGLSIDHIISPADRFLNIYSWYTKTENVWKIFAQ